MLNCNKNIFFSFILLFSFNITHNLAQPAPAEEENIPFLVTFGNESESSWGDDDFCQIFFCIIPFDRVEPVYIRVFDPGVGGEFDEAKGAFNTTTRFSVYGGRKCWSDDDAKGINPVGNYKSGIEFASKEFGNEPEYDGKWYTFGPINPFEGELIEKFGGRIIKIVAEGTKGDDGNLYQYFLSERPDKNQEIEGGNLFTYEYSFRLWDEKERVSQIYPYVDEKTISVKISNFDWDNDGIIKVISVAKNGIACKVSGEEEWKQANFNIVEKEKNTSLEIQFIKSQTANITKNNVCVIVQNQYGNSLPFYVIPIGGVPVYNPDIIMREIEY
ncbi:hypothetical protein OAO55_03370 [Bacteroidales bacterium]|nr:hypothetical protein [Bacteroidales bacterium]